MRRKWIIFSKLALLLVCIGFFMPMSCNQNGVELTKYCFEEAKDGEDITSFIIAICICLIFVAAILSIVISLLRIKKLNEYSLIADWILLGSSVFSGVFSFLAYFNRIRLELQIGAYLIVAGWLLSAILLLFASRSSQN
jgi:hypothetical protein